MSVYEDTTRIEPPDSPPESGEVHVNLPLGLVSLQSTRKKKKNLTDAVRKVTETARYLLSGEVHIDVEWLIHERMRWETDASADVDNTLKPLVDALCGPLGLLIDDCQVQSIACRWIDWNKDSERVLLTIKYTADDWIPKDNLVFVEIKDSLHFPFQTDYPPEALLLLIDQVDRMVAVRDNTLAKVGDYYAASRFLPVQRMFHRSRINRFKRMTIAEFRDLQLQRQREDGNPSGKE